MITFIVVVPGDLHLALPEFVPLYCRLPSELMGPKVNRCVPSLHYHGRGQHPHSAWQEDCRAF